MTDLHDQAACPACSLYCPVCDARMPTEPHRDYCTALVVTERNDRVQVRRAS
jgi:hypothetical protein